MNRKKTDKKPARIEAVKKTAPVLTRGNFLLMALGGLLLVIDAVAHPIGFHLLRGFPACHPPEAEIPIDKVEIMIREKLPMSFGSAEIKCRAVSSVGSEHLPYKQGVTGSNPVPPTHWSLLCRLNNVFSSFTIVLPLSRRDATIADGAGDGTCLQIPSDSKAVAPNLLFPPLPYAGFVKEACRFDRPRRSRPRFVALCGRSKLRKSLNE